jgi:hypothetical protein
LDESQEFKAGGWFVFIKEGVDLFGFYPPSDQIRCHLKGVAAGLGIDKASGVVNNPGEEGPVDVQGKLKL